MAVVPFFGRTGTSLWDLDPFDTALTFFDNAPTRALARDARAIASTNVDWVETPEAHIFRVDLPGVARNNIEVTIEDDRTLKISGERVKEEVKEGDTWHVVERVRGAFVRKFKLPENVKLDQIKAEVNNGVLSIVVPKADKKPQEPRSIEIGQGQPQSLEGGASQAGAPAATTAAGGATAAAARA
jgi:HSP20 family protein